VRAAKFSKKGCYQARGQRLADGLEPDAFVRLGGEREGRGEQRGGNGSETAMEGHHGLLWVARRKGMSRPVPLRERGGRVEERGKPEGGAISRRS
jgi:hypothetical protein